ncbi:flavin reductase family protein [Corynebacterium sp. YIM 101645]|uniref:Flavin reductase family protein n=1 Tax=Corynebacterium lemuris TaxID=1859292 RepID=A0ABT2FSQ0_9CORY|nr:flavin reductase family protein [Corynebacterium lemuris]MCS5478244.1 flavin reductase family protein [Corynebacterium lemuris]
MTTSLSLITRQEAPATIDPQKLRKAFGHFPSGIAAIAADVQGSPEVMVASSFSVGVSLDPPLVLFSAQKSSTTWPVIASADRIGVSVLSQEHSAACRQLASRNRDIRFSSVSTRTTQAGAVEIEGSTAWFDCSVFAVHEAGDHYIVVFRVHDLHLNEDKQPLVFHRSQFTHPA